MIVGNGLLAKAFCREFANEHDVVVFASGVSNSREHREEQFQREKEMLEAALDLGKFLLYFSTCSMADAALAETMYVRHKREMEGLIFARADRKAVFRLPQVVGATPNPHTLTNYLHHQITSGSRFPVWLHARRNLIDVDDVAAIVTHLVRTGRADGQLINVACPYSVSIVELVQHFEEMLKIKANYELVPDGAGYAIECGLTTVAAAELGIGFRECYIPDLLRKYYAGKAFSGAAMQYSAA